MRLGLGASLNGDWWLRNYGIDSTLAGTVIDLFDQTNPDTGSSVSSWPAIIGVDDLSQGTAGNQPVIVSGPPAARDFDGISDFMASAAMPSNTNSSIWWAAAIKLDDGQPAFDEYIWSIYDTNNDKRKTALAVSTAGRMEWILSSLGNNVIGMKSTEVAFDNGAMSDYAVVGGSYDASGSAALLYKNGTVFGSSDLAAGGPGAQLYDNAQPLRLGCVYVAGAASDFMAGAISIFILGSGTASGTQMVSIYDALSTRLGL